VDRDEALKLLKGGAEGVAEWNRRRVLGEQIHDFIGANLAEVSLLEANLGSVKLNRAKLNKANLSNADLSYSNLSDANLDAAILIGTNLRGSNLRWADLSNSNLSDTDLSDASLSNAYLSDANLSGAILIRTNLRKANLMKANLTEANLTRADLTGADLTRADLTEADLTEADLTGAHLTGALFALAYLSGAILVRTNLRKANLTGAHLTGALFAKANLAGADLTDANLAGADLTGANLTGANLTGADLTRADLTEADLTEADLTGAHLSGAICVQTSFATVDLSEVNRLDSIVHRGPSKIGLDTLVLSKGKIPEAFLHGCGVPDRWIEYLPSLIGMTQPIQFYSCFISYSTKDEDFAKQIHSKMRDEGLRVWFAPEDMQGGKKLHEQVDEAIRVFDKLLLILSPNSINSKWVRDEIRRARKSETLEGKRKLFPIRLTHYEGLRQWESFYADLAQDVAEEIREYFIPDFSNWKDHDSFEKAFARLLSDLKAEKPSESAPVA
jgi:uncharacterized protein YjbI with pentapeptide repeats